MVAGYTRSMISTKFGKLNLYIMTIQDLLDLLVSKYAPDFKAMELYIVYSALFSNRVLLLPTADV